MHLALHNKLDGIPRVVTLGLIAPLIGRLLDKFGTVKVLFGGTLLQVLGLFMLSIFASYSTYS